MTSSDKPRLHLDFTKPTTPPPTYSPHTYSPTSPTFPSGSPSSRRSSTDSMNSASTPKTPVMAQRIIMGALVSTPQSYAGSGEGDEVDEKECSLFVPGIVLTEPPHPPTPRIPSPPIRQTVLLAPTSLPIPPPSSMNEKSAGANGPQFSPAFMAFLHPKPKNAATMLSIRSMILIGVVVLGGWHLWSTLELGGLVEEAFEII
ncbi:hypothetical protein CI109_105979 [Kwoniella shandongensis]|uniref:Uncharacterized protein n=1 Tax=Kwoniella shandongensis TaxID=1734106 RepID=A0AAJ8LLD6_9TREE